MRVIDHDVVLSTIDGEGKERKGGVHGQEQIHYASLCRFSRDVELCRIESEGSPISEAKLYEEALVFLDCVMVEVGLAIH